MYIILHYELKIIFRKTVKVSHLLLLIKIIYVV